MMKRNQKLNKAGNSCAAILRRQKFIVTKIHHADGTTETRRERNPHYQWSLFNPFIRTFLRIRKRWNHKRIKKTCHSVWIEERNGEFVAVLAETGEIIERGASFDEVVHKTGIFRNINDPEPEIRYFLREPPRPAGEIFIPYFWREDESREKPSSE